MNTKTNIKTLSAAEGTRTGSLLPSVKLLNPQKFASFFQKQKLNHTDHYLVSETDILALSFKLIFPPQELF